MFVVDDVVLAPAKGLLWIFQEIHEAVHQEVKAESERIREELTRLYRLLEQGSISESEFDAKEATLLERLDELDALQSPDEGAGDPDDPIEDELIEHE